MGMGDEIMAAGIAEKLFRDTGQPVAIRDRNGQARTHAVWENNPAIDAKADQHITNAAGARPYIRRWHGGPRIEYDEEFRNDLHPAGPLHISEPVKLWETWSHHMTAGAVLIQKTVKRGGSTGKDWGASKWDEVERILHANDVACISIAEKASGGNTPEIITPTPQHAAAIIASVALVLCPEGGIHHLAGAMGTPALVYCGGFISPETISYSGQMYIYAGGEACGVWNNCAHCDEFRREVTPKEVASQALTMLHSITTRERSHNAA